MRINYEIREDDKSVDVKFGLKPNGVSSHTGQGPGKDTKDVPNGSWPEVEVKAVHDFSPIMGEKDKLSKVPAGILARALGQTVVTHQGLLRDQIDVAVKENAPFADIYAKLQELAASTTFTFEVLPEPERKEGKGVKEARVLRDKLEVINQVIDEFGSQMSTGEIAEGLKITDKEALKKWHISMESKYGVGKKVREGK